MGYFSEASIFKDDNELFDKIGCMSEYESDSENSLLSDAGFPIEEEFDNDNEVRFESKNMKGIYVNLDDRALAIESIMSVYDHNSILRGANSDAGYRKIVNKKGIEQTDLMIKKMTAKDKLLNATLDNYFADLIATDALLENRHTKADIEQINLSMQKDMKDKYGAEVADSDKRKDLIKKVQPPQYKHQTKKNVR